MQTHITCVGICRQLSVSKSNDSTDWTIGALLFERRVFPLKMQILHFLLHNAQHFK